MAGSSPEATVPVTKLPTYWREINGIPLEMAWGGSAAILVMGGKVREACGKSGRAGVMSAVPNLVKKHTP